MYSSKFLRTTPRYVRYVADWDNQIVRVLQETGSGPIIHPNRDAAVAFTVFRMAKNGV